MKVSIIVPVYNVERYLKRCMNSILNQTLDDFEIILVDDGSTDRSHIICDEYATTISNVKVIHKKNEGLGLARNSGMEIATGEYVAFLDSDDYVDFEMYKTMYEYAINNSLDAVYCSYDRIKDGERNSTGINYKEKIYSDNISEVILGMIGSEPSEMKDFKFEMSSCMSIYKREIIQSSNIKFYSERKYISEDLLFNMQFLYCASKIGVLNKYFYHYCINDNSLTSTFKADRYKKDKEMYFEIKNELKRIGIQDKQMVTERFILSRLRIQAKNIVLNQNIKYKEKRKYLSMLSSDELFINLMKTYPINNMPAVHRMFYRMLYEKYYMFVFMMYRLKEKCM